MHVASASPRAQRAVDTDTKSLLTAGPLTRRPVGAGQVGGASREVVRGCRAMSRPFGNVLVCSSSLAGQPARPQGERRRGHEEQRQQRPRIAGRNSDGA